MRAINDNRSLASAENAIPCLNWAAVFMLPIAVFCAALAWNGVYPFGEESFLTEDLRYQYIDFFSWLRSVLRGEASLQRMVSRQGFSGQIQI